MTASETEHLYALLEEIGSVNRGDASRADLLLLLDRCGDAIRTLKPAAEIAPRSGRTGEPVWLCEPDLNSSDAFCAWTSSVEVVAAWRERGYLIHEVFIRPRHPRGSR